MKKIFFATFAIGSVAALCSCNDNADILSSANNIKLETEHPYAISVERALANLEDFMNSEDNTESRGGEIESRREVASITPIRYVSGLSRSSDQDIECENLLYVANFEQEQGYAILAADERISEKVIAVTDEGYLSDATVYTAMELMNAERVMVDGYPTSGPGFFTLPETGDELYMNPNTVCLFIEDEQDTLVGNFFLDDDFDDSGSRSGQFGIQPNLAGRISTPQVVTTSLSASYAVQEIENFDKLRLNPVEPPMVDGNRTEKHTSYWNVTKKVYPLLSPYREWVQREPYNDLCPKRRQWLVAGKRKRALVGCFPMAISKLMTRFEFPSNYTYNGYRVDWKELNSNIYSETSKKSVAHLLRGVGHDCQSWYFYQGTFTFPHLATSCMRRMGFKNVDTKKYAFDKVSKMVDAGRPLIIYASPGIKIWESHSWNIDGYQIKERTVTTDTYENNKLVMSTSRTETCNMVHCDFGWGGACNGYYISGLFKLNEPTIEYDYNSAYTRNINYTTYVRIITYDNP